jgi:hypothetical protein
MVPTTSCKFARRPEMSPGSALHAGDGDANLHHPGGRSQWCRPSVQICTKLQKAGIVVPNGNNDDSCAHPRRVPTMYRASTRRSGKFGRIRGHPENRTADGLWRPRRSSGRLAHAPGGRSLIPTVVITARVAPSARSPCSTPERVN